MASRHLLRLIWAGIIALAGAGAAYADMKLANTAWVSYERECTIRKLEFTSNDHAVLAVTWQASGGQWTLKDGKLHIDFEFDATLDGTVKNEGEIDAIFNWVSKDLRVPHKENCVLKRAKAQ
jgi:hypothetical protein